MDSFRLYGRRRELDRALHAGQALLLLFVATEFGADVSAWPHAAQWVWRYLPQWWSSSWVESCWIWSILPRVLVDQLWIAHERAESSPLV